VRRRDALDVRGHATEQTAAADRAKHGIDVRHVRLAADLHANRALPRNHKRVVKRRNHRQAMRLREAHRLGLGLVKVGTVENDLGAEPLDILPLDARRPTRHHNRARDRQVRAAHRDALRVVPRTAGNDALPLARVIELAHHVVCTTQLEAKHRLHILTLQKHLASKSRRQARRWLQRRLPC